MKRKPNGNGKATGAGCKPTAAQRANRASAGKPNGKPLIVARSRKPTAAQQAARKRYVKEFTKRTGRVITKADVERLSKEEPLSGGG